MKHLLIVAGAIAFTASGAAYAKPGHGRGHGYGNGGCPPGLRDKGCMPPGQAKKLNRGQRWQNGYGDAYAYRSIPYELRRRYALNPGYRYYYDNGYLYAVNPRTMLIAQVISALLR